jgi:hypothetical protein
MQADEHLTELRFELGEVLEVIQTQLVADGHPRHAYGKSLHGAQGRRGETDKDVRRGWLGQGSVPRVEQSPGSNL